nr:MAG TPA: hypothetical protein [Caudoviricetes sp.]
MKKCKNNNMLPRALRQKRQKRGFHARCGR